MSEMSEYRENFVNHMVDNEQKDDDPQEHEQQAIVPAPDLGEKVTFSGKAKLFKFISMGWQVQSLDVLKIILDCSNSSWSLLMVRTKPAEPSLEHKIEISENMCLTQYKHSDLRANTFEAQDFSSDDETLQKYLVRFKTFIVAHKFRVAFGEAVDALKTLSVILEPPQAFMTAAQAERQEQDVNPLAGSVNLLDDIPCCSGSSSALFARAPVQDKPEEVVKEEAKPLAPNTPAIALPEFWKVVTGEENEEILFEQRVKLLRYAKDFEKWMYYALGYLKVLRDKADPEIMRLLVRRDVFYMVCCNQRLTSKTKFKCVPSEKEAVFWVSMGNAVKEVNNTLLCLRFQRPQLRNAFLEVVPKAQDSSEEEEQDQAKPQPLPVTLPQPKLPAKVNTGEVGENTQFEARAKLLRFSQQFGEWQEYAVGTIKLLRGKIDPQQERLLMRCDDFFEVCANQRLVSTTKFHRIGNHKEAVAWVTMHDEVKRISNSVLCLRFKKRKICKKFLHSIKASQNNMVLFEDLLKRIAFFTEKKEEKPEPEKEQSKPRKSKSKAKTPKEEEDKDSDTEPKPSTSKTQANEEQETDLEEESSNADESSDEEPDEKAKLIKELLYTHHAELSRFIGGKWSQVACGDVRIYRRTWNKELTVQVWDKSSSLFLEHYLTRKVYYTARDEKGWKFGASDRRKGNAVAEKFALHFEDKEDAKLFKTAINKALQDQDNWNEKKAQKEKARKETPKKPKQQPMKPKKVSIVKEVSFIKEESKAAVATVPAKKTLPEPVVVVEEVQEEKEDTMEVLYEDFATLLRLDKSEWLERAQVLVQIMRYVESKELRVVMLRDISYEVYLDFMLTPKGGFSEKDGLSWTFDAVDPNRARRGLDRFKIRFSCHGVAIRFKAALEDALSGKAKAINYYESVDQEDDNAGVSAEDVATTSGVSSESVATPAGAQPENVATTAGVSPGNVATPAEEMKEILLFGSWAKYYDFDADAKLFTEKGCGDLKVMQRVLPGKPATSHLIMHQDESNKLLVNMDLKSDSYLHHRQDTLVCIGFNLVDAEGNVITTGTEQNFGFIFGDPEIVPEFMKVVNECIKRATDEK